GQVGVGTGNLCECRFGNVGGGMLKVTGVKATCGCTVVQLDKREYAAAECRNRAYHAQKPLLEK
ncbi:MAG: DUF1573 domain-containing protein, partial [Phycisphaerales bacterium]